ncbi:phosphatase PAP2 family protein [Candidatus Micrarchaeota archaeon]|nr:phosphatase PAP2 family protein [Candidatus Micrarchaeota archaeon]
MDAITLLIQSVSLPYLNQINMLLDLDYIYVLLVLGLIALGERRNDKRAKILTSIVLAIIVGFAIKHIIAEPRPCIGKEFCPKDYSFPSLHATIAFALMTGFLNKKNYAWYLLFAIFVGFSRINFGVHTFIDVAGALPIALISYYVVDILWSKFIKEGKGDRR